MFADWSVSPLQHPRFPDLRENSTVTFTCGCSAYPAPNIVWYMTDQPGKRKRWILCRIGKESKKELQGEKILQVNSTYTVTARLDLFGVFFRCNCSTWHSSRMSDVIQLRFLRMVGNLFCSPSRSVIWQVSFRIILTCASNVIKISDSSLSTKCSDM